MRVERYKESRYFAVYDGAGQLVAVTVYKRGAEEVKRRLSQATETTKEAADDSAASRSFTTVVAEGKDGTYGY